MFYNADTWVTQTATIIAYIKREVVARRRAENTEHFRKNLSRTFFIPSSEYGDVKVCKMMFMKTLQISSARIHRAIQKTKCDKIEDRRGSHEPHNKSSFTTIDVIREHIKSFPVTPSHYTRKCTNKKYLGTNLNLSLMYRLFVEYLKEKGNRENIPRQSLYDKVFRRDFNLSFRPPRKDTCRTCDSLKIQIQVAEESNSVEEIARLKSSQELHHRRVDCARDTIQLDERSSKAENGPNVITFVLQKVMLLPELTTGEVYYKRQLSCYNFGMHDFSFGTGAMHVWDETVASRGAQEVGSCIIKYLKTHDTKEQLIAWSDSCGGQNRNFKLAFMWMYMIECPEINITEVTHKFAEPGHSYLQNDSEFGDIERKMKRHPEVYTPRKWHEIISEARTKKNKFEVVQMEKYEFKSIVPLQNLLISRKKSETGDNVEWLKIKQMRFKRAAPGVMEYKYSHNPLVEFSSVNFNRRLKGRPAHLKNVELPVLYPRGRLLSEMKLKDLKSLLKYVPPIHHSFYNNLESTTEEQETTLEHDCDDDVCAQDDV